MIRHLWKLVCSSLKRKLKKRLKKIKKKQAIKAKGQQGEAIVSAFLDTLPTGKALNDVILYEKGHYTQIDHIFITANSLYVIETKNYSGQVTIDETADQWVVTYSNGRKYNLYSPIKQNTAHVNKLAYLTGITAIKSLIVFPDPQCKLIGKASGVTDFSTFKSYMLSNTSTLSEVILDKERIYKVIKHADKSKSAQVRRKQIKYASKMSILNKK